MHDKYKNFYGFLADTYLQYFSPNSGDNEISTKIRHVADEKANYKNYQFGYLALVCNNETTRPSIEAARNIYKDEEKLKELIVRVRGWTTQGKAILERIESIPDEDIKEFFIKASRYINLFTSMYFKQK